jgi:hypothetical protein
MVKYPSSFRQWWGMYRIFLLRHGKIAAHYEFRAENDARACRAAALAFDACADYCDDFELWYGALLVTSRAGLKTLPASGTAEDAFEGAPAAAVEAGIRGMAAAILAGAMQTSDALRNNPQVNAQLDALRRQLAGPQ